MISKAKLLLNFLLGIFLLHSQLEAHTRWFFPPHRLNEDIKVSPCGGVKRGNATTFEASKPVQITWEEFINHPGSFSLYFSTGDETKFTHLITIKDTISTGKMNYTWTPPAMACSTCVLQVIQTMTDRNPPTLYHSCADVAIKITTPVLGHQNKNNDNNMPSIVWNAKNDIKNFDASYTILGQNSNQPNKQLIIKIPNAVRK